MITVPVLFADFKLIPIDVIRVRRTAFPGHGGGFGGRCGGGYGGRCGGGYGDLYGGGYGDRYGGGHRGKFGGGRGSFSQS